MLNEINGINNTSNLIFKKIKEQNEKTKLEYKKDSFERTTKEDKSNNGKFDISECAKNFAQGVLSPLKAVVEHPVATVGILGATTLACTLVPVLTPIMGVGFGALSVYQLGKGCYNAAKNYKNKEYDNAEKSFNQIGQGFVGTVTSALGLKQGAKVAKEAKLMNELGTQALNQAQKDAIALEVKNGSYADALKEVGSLFTSKEGLNATINQFKPSMIKARGGEILDFVKGNKYKEKEIKQKIPKRADQIEKFKKSEEGIRRANLTDEEIEAEVNSLFKKAFDELEIPEEQRPKLVIRKSAIEKGGYYEKGSHSLEYNPEAYKSGVFEMDDVVMHEATHCKEALQRAGISKERASQLVKDELVSRVQNGENEKILKAGGFCGAEMMTPPKMSEAMKSDFIEFANENLYNNNNKFTNNLYSFAHVKPGETPVIQEDFAPIVDKMKTIIKNHPEFVEQYESEEKALNVLAEYSLSHVTRYNYFSDVSVGLTSSKIKVAELSGEKLLQAEQSLIDEITTIEGNARMSGINGFFAGQSDFNQYQFSPEEVLAQKNGHNFLIKNLTEKMAQMKADGTLTPENEAYMNKLIDKSKLTIEYKTKGLEYYEKYTKLINNPNNTELAKDVQALKRELNVLNSKLILSSQELEEIKFMIKVPDIGASVEVPLSTLPAAEIIKENIENE